MEDAELQEALARAHRLGDEGDWEGMAEHLRGLLEDRPEDPFVLCWLGVAERELGLESVAYQRFRACVGQQPEDAHVLATAGNALAAADDPEAESALRTAALIAPDLPLARWMYGAYLSREGFHEKAVEELQAARELDPHHPVIAYELGVAHALAEHPARAVDALFEAIELDREDGWARVVLGLVLIEDDRLEEGVSELTAGARLRPSDVEAQLLASLAAASTGREDLAWEMLERGRMGAVGADQALTEAVDERVVEGPEAAERFLRADVLPGALRERLMVRP